MSNPAFSAFSALSLKVVGAILIISSLVDYLILAIPNFSPLNPEWQMRFITQIVDRGVIPMIGMTLIIVGYWIGETIGSDSGKIGLTDLRFWSFILASLLGLMFLLFIPVHISTLGRAKTQAMRSIDQSATAAEQQIESQIGQVEQLINDTARQEELNAAINSGQLEGDQLTQLQAIQEQINLLKDDPAALENQVNEAKTQLETRRKEAENQANLSAFTSGIRIGVSSLLLSVGYILIGWNGFRGLAGGGGGGGRRRMALK